MNCQLPIFIIVIILCDIITQSKSTDDGLSWKEKQKSYFDNEIDAANKLNKLCDKIETTPQNPEICEILNQQERKQTSKFRNVNWKKEIRKWCVQFWINGEKQCGGCFNNELDAAKSVNQLCENMGVPLHNPGISAIPDEKYQFKTYTSQYKGVSHDRKWIARLHLKGQTPKYGGHFNDEIDAAKKVNQLCEELGIPPHNPGISAIPDEKYQARKQKESKYKGVYWNQKQKKWYVRVVLIKGQKQKYGGIFDDELDAAKKVNQLCEDFGIPNQNPVVSATPNGQQNTKTSQYTGVNWHLKSKKWYAQVAVKGDKVKFGGTFNDELDAAKSVNYLCKELGIPPKNPGISAEKYQKKQKKSQYQSVFWHKLRKKWYVMIQMKGQKQYGGNFNDELDAGKRVNQLCEEMGITLQNPLIRIVQNYKYQETLRNDDTIQAEFTRLIKILDKHNDTIAATITKDILEAINDGEQAIMTQINLCTKNGESALCIAAKHGFSNAVKFLISKGAEKEHFTNEHHTPLSLAVSHNHLNVVQVLFEDWISPNFHEKPYLHLSPIFNVKSKEIAQLLIDNDAVTHDITTANISRHSLLHVKMGI